METDEGLVPLFLHVRGAADEDVCCVLGGYTAVWAGVGVGISPAEFHFVGPAPTADLLGHPEVTAELPGVLLVVAGVGDDCGDSGRGTSHGSCLHLLSMAGGSFSRVTVGLSTIQHRHQSCGRLPLLCPVLLCWSASSHHEGC